jgi:hypothetical protein
MYRAAITRVEVAVVAVIGLLCLGFLAIVLGRQRENGLRVQCVNNLRRMGEAVQSFNMASDKAAPFLPPARIADDYATWAVLIAPHLVGERADTKTWDVSRTYFAQEPVPREWIIPNYFCPARRRPSWLSVTGDIDPASEKHVPGAVGDYAGVAGTGDPAHPWDGPNADGPMILGEVLQRDGDRIVAWRGRTSIGAIHAARGLSTTLLVGEKHVPAGQEGQADVGDASLYNGQNPSTSTRVAGPGFGLAQSVTDPFNFNFGSTHVGVCQFLLADGSMRAFAVDMSDTVLGQMARRGK